MNADRDYFVSFPDCPKCGERGFTWRASDVIAAYGCAMCDECGWMIETSNEELIFLVKTMVFSDDNERNEVLMAWHDGVLEANAEWEQRKSKPKKPCPDCADTGVVVHLFKDGDCSRCHCAA